MKKTLAGSGLILALLSPATQAEGMAGISLGQAFYNDNALAAYYAGRSANIDSQSISYKIHGGTPLNNNLSIHAGLYSLGNTSTAFTNTIIIDNNGTPEEIPLDSISQQLESRGFFIEGRWQWLPGKAWRPYVKAGLATNTSRFKTTRTPINSTQPSTTNADSRSSAALVPGIGLVYESLHHWGLQLEWERYLGLKAPSDIPKQDVDGASLGIYGYW